MAFPSASKASLSTIWAAIKSTTGRMKDQANRKIQAASVTRMQVLEIADQLADSLAYLDVERTAPGLLAYAQNEENDPALNLVTEFATMRVQIVAVQDWIVANFPKDVSGNLITYTFDANKKRAEILLTAGQLTALKAQLTALVATIQ